jgi:hypothetical protein
LLPLSVSSGVAVEVKPRALCIQGILCY